MNGFQKFLVVIAIIVVLLITWVALRDRVEKQDIVSFLRTPWFKIIVAVFVAIVVFFVVKYRKRLWPAFAVEGEVPKEPVDSDVALDAFRDAFFLRTGVPTHFREGVLVPAFGVVFFHKNTRTRSSHSTGSVLFDVEFYCSHGSQRGVNTVTIRKDAGVDSIAKNTTFSFRAGENLWEADLNIHSFPVDTPSSERARLVAARHEEAMAGVGRDDLRAWDEHIASLEKNGAPETVVAPVAAAESYSMEDVAAESSDVSPSNEDEWRAKNKKES